MHLVEILIDKRVSCEFIDARGAENVIFCRPVEESLDNVATITTKSSEFIHSFITEASGENYLVTSIKLPGGEVYSDVRFKLITCESDELPQSTIDTSILGMPSEVDRTSPKSQILNEVVQHIEPDLEQEELEYQEYEHKPSNSAIIEQVKQLEAKLVEQQRKLKTREEQLKSRQDAIELNEKLQKTLEDYKSELLVEYYSVSDKQQNILSSQLNDLSSSLFKFVKEKLKDQKFSNETLLRELSNENIKTLQGEQDAAIGAIKDEISSLLSEKIKENVENTDRLLIERTGELQQLFSEKLILELEDHKQNIQKEINGINLTIDNLVENKLQAAAIETDKQLVNRAGDLQAEFANKLQEDLSEHKTKLFEEFKQVSTEASNNLFSEKTDELNAALEELLNEHKQNLNDTISQKINEVGTSINAFKVDVDGKLPKLDKTIEDINNRINTLLQEKRNVQSLVDSAKQYTDTAVARASQDAKDYARRILELGGGGGSNAAQYAHGGIINGDLSVTGQYLSGGVNIISILSGGGGGGSGREDVNTVVISNSANWDNTYTTVQSNSATTWNYQGSDLKALSGNWENTYTSWSNASATSVVEFNDTRFSKLSAQVYQAGPGASSIQPTSGNNTASGDYSAILGGQNNTVTHINSFAIGSNITSSADNTTYVNNISSSGSVYGTFYGDGSNLTGITTNSYIYQQSDFSSAIGKNYLVDTSTNVVNVTLPGSPQVGDVILFEDFAGTWAITPMILLNNGNLIESYNTPLTANLNSFNFKLIYTGATYGWRLY